MMFPTRHMMRLENSFSKSGGRFGVPRLLSCSRILGEDNEGSRSPVEEGGDLPEGMTGRSYSGGPEWGGRWGFSELGSPCPVSVSFCGTGNQWYGASRNTGEA
jgi:hypothetical protein